MIEGNGEAKSRLLVGPVEGMVLSGISAAGKRMGLCSRMQRPKRSSSLWGIGFRCGDT